MKNLIFILTVIVLLFSCKKEEKYNCVDGSCVTAENGKYSSKEDCQNQCSNSSNTGSSQDDYYESTHPEIGTGTGVLNCEDPDYIVVSSDDGNWSFIFWDMPSSGNVVFKEFSSGANEAEMTVADERDTQYWNTSCGDYDASGGTGSWNGNVFTYSITIEDLCPFATEDPNQYTLEGQFTCN